MAGGQRDGPSSVRAAGGGATPRRARIRLAAGRLRGEGGRGGPGRRGEGGGERPWQRGAEAGGGREEGRTHGRRGEEAGAPMAEARGGSRAAELQRPGGAGAKEMKGWGRRPRWIGRGCPRRQSMVVRDILDLDDTLE